MTEPVAEAVEYETLTFNPGNASLRNTPLQPYQGTPTRETDLAWWHLYDGMEATNFESSTCLTEQLDLWF
jgi:hypothetical protein